MKELRITGLGQETEFEAGITELRSFLVINKGELRIPISSEYTQKVLELLMSNGVAPAREEPTREPSRKEEMIRAVSEEEDVFGGISDEKTDDDQEGHDEQPEDEVFDEDGVGQV